MEISCKTCIHKKVCDLWRKQECQSAKNFFNDECELYAAERKKGKWVQTNPPERSDNIVCDQCGYDSIAKFIYCPNCGAQMEVTDGSNKMDPGDGTVAGERW